MVPFNEWGSTARRRETLRGDSLLFITKTGDVLSFKTRYGGQKGMISLFLSDYTLFDIPACEVLSVTLITCNFHITG